MAVGESTVHRWIDSGKLPAFRCGQTVRIREQALLEFILEYSTV